jgi:hypothetical protein
VRCTLAATLLVALAAAEPDVDGAVAEAARWVEPRGCASGSFRSRALPVVTEVEEAWRLDSEAVEAPPVHWDGTGYVVARAAKKLHLVAFDLGTGKEIARTQLPGFVRESGLLVWDHLVLLQPNDEQISGYRISGRSFEVRWRFRGWDVGFGVPDRPRLPAVHDNEVYCLLGDDLGRVRPGLTSPTWCRRLWKAYEPGAGEPRAARPAVYGDHVFVAWLGPEFEGRAPGRLIPGTFADVRLAVRPEDLLPWEMVYKAGYESFMALSRDPQHARPVVRRWRLGRRDVVPARLFYEQAAATVHFLYHGEGGAYRERLLDYVTAHYAGRREGLAIGTAFGMTPAELGRKVEAYARRVADGWRPAGQ